MLWVLWVGYTQSLDALKNKNLRLPKEGSLPPEHKIDILPEFPGCCPEDFTLKTVASILSAGGKPNSRERKCISKRSRGVRGWLGDVPDPDSS